MKSTRNIVVTLSALSIVTGLLSFTFYADTSRVLTMCSIVLLGLISIPVAGIAARYGHWVPSIIAGVLGSVCTSTGVYVAGNYIAAEPAAAAALSTDVVVLAIAARVSSLLFTKAARD